QDKETEPLPPPPPRSGEGEEDRRQRLPPSPLRGGGGGEGSCNPVLKVEGSLSERPRILVFDSPGLRTGTPLERCEPDCEIVRVDNVAQGLALLRTEHFDGVYANPQDPAFWERAGSLLQADYILDVLADGVALVNSDLRITWANRTFEKWCGGYGKGRSS